MSKESSSSGGVGLLGLIFFIFLTLKLCNIIHWKWIWVTAPLWGGVFMVIGITIILYIIKAIR